MSTRCQIEFKHIYKYLKDKKPVVWRRTVYRHSDGYPEGVIPDLQEFFKWNSGRNNDIEYQTANFIYWSKRRHEELYWKPKGNNEQGGIMADNLHIGFGVCENDGFHGDIEYFYELIRETTEKSKSNYETKTYLLVYEVTQKDYSKPVTRKNLKLIKTIKFLDKEK